MKHFSFLLSLFLPPYLLICKNFLIYVLGYHGAVTGLTCRGDSGGPLVEFNSEEEYYVQVGIVSGGACQSENEPAVFARIEDDHNFEFITKQFWDHISPTNVNKTVPCKDFILW